MEALHIREELHEYINNADDRLINLLYAMVQADMTEADYQLTDEHKKILDSRLTAHDANRTSGSSWEEVKSRVRTEL